MISRTDSLKNSKLMRDYLALNPRLRGADLVERMQADHGITIVQKNAQNIVCRYRAELRKAGRKIPKNSGQPSTNGHHAAQPNAVAAAIVSLKAASIVLGGKEPTKQVLDAIY